MLNKRGQELSTSTIVLLILGIIILVLLALGFTSGWSKVFPWLSSSNVDQVKSLCSSACAVNGEYEYCRAPRTLVTSDKSEKIIDSTCFYLATYQPKYGVESCNIDCETRVQVFDRITNKDLEGKTTSSEINEYLNAKCAENDFALKGKRLQALGLSTDKKTSVLYSYDCVKK